MKKILMLLMVLALLLCLGAAAADVIASGTMTPLSDGSENGTWTLDDQGVLYLDCQELIWGESAIPQDTLKQVSTIRFSAATSKINNITFYYMHNIMRYEVDEENTEFTSIDGYLCSKDGTELLRCPPGKSGSVTIPDGVKTIGFSAFYECSEITDVVLSDTVEELKQQSFFNCYKLTDFRISKSVRSINIYAFGLMPDFEVDEENETFTAVDGVLLTKDPYAVFMVPDSKTGTYTAPDVTEIGQYAFGSSKVTEVTLPEGVTAIRKGAFQHSSLQVLHLPSTVSLVEEDAFANCEQLSEIHFAGTMAQWAAVQIQNGNADLLFQSAHCSDGNCPPLLTQGRIGDGITYTLSVNGNLTVSGAGVWDSDAFYNNPSIRKVTLEPGVTEIGWSAFMYCRNLESITIPDSVETIHYRAFLGCEALKTIDIPASVTNIGDKELLGGTDGEPFDECSSLRDVYYGRTMDEWNAMVSPASNSGMLMATVHCSDGDIPPAYSSMPEEDYRISSVTETIRRISTGRGQAFAGTGEIPDHVFVSWYGPKMADVMEGITGIGSYSISSIDTLKDVYLPVSLKTIGDGVLTNCPKLEHVYYAGTREQFGQISISESTLAVIRDLVICADEQASGPALSGTFGENLTWSLDNSGRLTISGTGDIPDFAWNGAPWYACRDSIVSIEIQDGVTGIGSYLAFDYGSLTGLTIADTVAFIHENALSYCDVLTEITIPAGVTSIALPAQFEGCTNLTDIFVAENNPAYVSVDGIVLSSDCTRALFCPPGKQSAVIPEGVTAISSYAFSKCAKLESIEIPLSVASVEYAAFHLCSSLKDVYYAGKEADWAKIQINSTSGFNQALADAAIHYVQLTAPVVRVTEYSTAGRDVTIEVSCEDDCDMITLDSLNNYEIQGSSGTATLLGFWFREAGPLTVSATAWKEVTLEDSSTDWVSSATSSVTVVLAEPETELPGKPEVVFSAMEAPYGEDITFTIPGADAVTYLAFWEGMGGGMPSDFQLGDTASPIYGDPLNNPVIPGRWEVMCWGRFNGIWSDSTNWYSVNILPLGTLKPVIQFGGTPVTSEHLYLDINGSLNFTINPEDADSTYLLVSQVEGEFNPDTHSDDPLYFLTRDPNEYTTLAEFETKENPVTLDLMDYLPETGVYRIYATSSKEGWASEFSVLWVHLETVGDRILTLPASLTAIESQAFADLTNVDAIRIPASVESIADDAFSGSDIVILTPVGSYAETWAQNPDHMFTCLSE